MDKDFVLNTLNKIYDFALKNNYKKEIVKHFPKGLRFSEQWKINIYKNYISYSDIKPLEVMNKSDLFSEREKTLIKSIEDGFIAPFELLNNENCWQIYNFVNEKEYTAYPVKFDILKAKDFKYFVSMIINFEGCNYILDVVNNIKNKRNALFLVKEILLEDSTIIYKDNQKKEEEVKTLLQRVYSEFIDIFGDNGFLVDSDMATTIADLFFDVIEAENEEVRNSLIGIFKDRRKEETPSNYQDIESINSETDEEAVKETPTAIFVIKDKGLYLAKEYSILEKIYETGDFNFIYESSELLYNYFLEDVPDYPVEAVLKLYEESEDKEKFLEITRNIINELSEDYEFDRIHDIKSLNVYELLDIVKENYDSELTTYSLYTLKLISNSISELFEEAESVVAELTDIFEKQKEKTCLKGEDSAIPEKIGRNDTCYCGSGKKYKKCCME